VIDEFTDLIMTAGKEVEAYVAGIDWLVVCWHTGVYVAKLDFPCKDCL
jgi:hypothetical protein